MRRKGGKGIETLQKVINYEKCKISCSKKRKIDKKYKNRHEIKLSKKKKMNKKLYMKRGNIQVENFVKFVN